MNVGKTIGTIIGIGAGVGASGIAGSICDNFKPKNMSGLGKAIFGAGKLGIEAAAGVVAMRGMNDMTGALTNLCSSSSDDDSDDSSEEDEIEKAE